MSNEIIDIAPVPDVEESAPKRAKRRDLATWISFGLIALFVFLAVFSPLFVGDYLSIDTLSRLKPPGSDFWFGTDHLGRDIFARTLIGSRNTLIVGGCVALLTTVLGTVIGLVAGYFRIGEGLIMRIMDGLMAIPSVLLAIALISLMRGGLVTVIIAITIPEIPRMVRLVRSVVLTLKEQLYVTAAISIGTTTPNVLRRHILPNAVGALTVQATYVCASAMIVEAVLSFLGIGTPPEFPSWGNIMATGRHYFQIAPWIIGFPGIFLSVLVLSINILGDSLRDSLDPRLRKGGRL